MIDRTVAAIVAAIALLAATALIHSSAVAATPQPDGSAVLVLIPQPKSSESGYEESFIEGFASIPELSVGLTSATQGSYRRGQALLDISQGTRVSRSTYSPETVPLAGRLRPVRTVPPGISISNVPPDLRAAKLSNWPAILERAESAPQTIEPGLLAGSVPGGAAWISASPGETEAAIPAADRRGRIASAGYLRGSVAALSGKVMRLTARHQFTVVNASPGRRGLKELRRIVADLGPDQLLIAMQSPPEAAILPLLPIAATGLDGPPGGLTSDTTNLPNLVAGIDIAPTVLDHLGLEIPDEMKGRVMRSEGDREPEELTPFRDRLDELGPRRNPALLLVGAGWLALLLAAGAILGISRSRLPVRRIGGLAILWIPSVILIPAALGNPSREARVLDHRLRQPRAGLAERPADAVAEGTADPGGGRPGGVHRGPGSGLPPDHPLDPRAQPRLRIALLRGR